MSLTILVTGGLGYIGSHTVVKLLENNYTVIIIDNLYNSYIETLDNLKFITNKNIIFYNLDITNFLELNKIFSKHKIDVVIHFAGLKSVADSISEPLLYYNNNITGTLNLLTAMQFNSCKKIIFSSSATVYGTQEYPVTEDAKTGENITNPYGKTKYMIEEILKDIYNSDNSWSIILLRYFNPIGSHNSGLLTENPKDKPNNLFPHILNAYKNNAVLKIFGNDYNTPDGTCIRDFIHVEDLANGHIKAINKINENKLLIYNLGTGKGTSVLELVNIFNKVNNCEIKYEFTNRRQGDLPFIYAITDKAKEELDFVCEKTLEDMCLIK
jgi:UDP-glucose 4-epimerase